MKIYLDGIEVAYPNNTLLEPSFSIRRQTQNEGATISFTGDLSFTGIDYDYIYNKLVADPNGINNKIELLFVDDCCDNKEYIFVIKPESIEWCEGKCELSANALEYSVDSNAYACFENTLIWGNSTVNPPVVPFEELEHPRIAYCLEFRPNVIQHIILILVILTSFSVIFLSIIALIIQTIINSINLVIQGLNLLIPGTANDIEEITIGGSDSETNLYDWFLHFNEKVAQFAVGCGYDHPSPLVRTYINNVCGQCGVAFTSSILNDPTNNPEYYKLVYFSAQVRKGQTKFDTLRNYLETNKPILNLKMFLDEISQPFNAKWDIHNGVLRFERKDFFQSQIPWLDLTTYDSEKIISVCYTWTKNPRPSYGDFQYSMDAMDWVGSEAIQRWSDIIEWNDPYTPLQKGPLEKHFAFGAARFRGDAIDPDVLKTYEDALMGIGDAIKANEDVMLMNNGTAFLPKLLILRDGWESDYTHCLIENKYATFAGAGSHEDVYPNEPYNYPMWVRDEQPGNLYDAFWKIEDPRLTTFSGFDFTATIIWDCTTLNSVDIDGTVMLSQGLGKVTSVDLDFETSTMIIKGTL